MKHTSSLQSSPRGIGKGGALPLLLLAAAGGLATPSLASPPTALPPLPLVVPVEPLPNELLVPGAEIEGWKAGDCTDEMRAHAWQLFAAVMRPVYDRAGETVRLFDTWYSLDEAVPPLGEQVLDIDPSMPVRAAPSGVRLGALQQATHFARSGGQLPSGAGRLGFSEVVVSDVKYNAPIARWIQDALTNVEILDGRRVVASYRLRDALLPGAPASLDFTDVRGVMLKPAFTIIKAAGPTIIGRWEEALAVNNPPSIGGKLAPTNADARVASERTWVREAVVVPPGVALEPGATYFGRDGAPLVSPDVSGLPIFSVEHDFHYLRLDQAMVDSLRTGILFELMGPNIERIEVGDYAVLTSMHIATREVDDWTWQTFWWQPTGGGSLSDNGAPRDVIERTHEPGYAPLAHFRGGVGYDFATASGEPVICSNPYLEGSFGLKPDLDAVFGPEALTDGVNVFLRDAAAQPLSHDGVAYVHDGNGLATNCITCHLAAAYPANSLGALPAGSQGVYPDYGALSGQEALFVDRLRTHFVWGLANKVTEHEATTPFDPPQ